MDNKSIAALFRSLAKVMELHDENPFKVRSYQNAGFQIDRMETALAEIPEADWHTLPGIGAAIAGKIREIMDTGSLELLERYLNDTPAGVLEMLQLQGLGGKKIHVLWKELGITTLQELKQACLDGRIATTKGFGEKTQANILEAIRYRESQRDFVRLDEAMEEAEFIIGRINSLAGVETVSHLGVLRRCSPVLDRLELMAKGNMEQSATAIISAGILHDAKQENGVVKGTTASGLPVLVHCCEKKEAPWKAFRLSSAPAHIEALAAKEGLYEDERAIYRAAGKPYIIPEMREGLHEWDWAARYTEEDLVTEPDIRGVLHAHSTWSDGTASLEEMALACMDRGFEYLLITDHSQTAVYARGLKPEAVRKQQDEIARLNHKLKPFRIFSGIESDILTDGSLDYESGVLSSFDCVIASIHSGLRMPQDKATQRLIRAIDNPHTAILGHPTGRLLLSRPGYPIDHDQVIAACARNGVAIEINANPHRLDLDWQWVWPAMQAGIMIAINPDAHSTHGIGDIRWGISAARKGGLVKQMCLNALSVDGFEQWLKNRQHGQPSR